MTNLHIKKPKLKYKFCSFTVIKHLGKYGDICFFTLFTCEFFSAWWFQKYCFSFVFPIWIVKKRVCWSILSYEPSKTATRWITTLQVYIWSKKIICIYRYIPSINYIRAHNQSVFKSYGYRSVSLEKINILETILWACAEWRCCPYRMFQISHLLSCMTVGMLSQKAADFVLEQISHVVLF